MDHWVGSHHTFEQLWIPKHRVLNTILVLSQHSFTNLISTPLNQSQLFPPFLCPHSRTFLASVILPPHLLYFLIHWFITCSLTRCFLCYRASWHPRRLTILAQTNVWLWGKLPDHIVRVNIQRSMFSTQYFLIHSSTQSQFLNQENIPGSVAIPMSVMGEACAKELFQLLSYSTSYCSLCWNYLIGHAIGGY